MKLKINLYFTTSKFMAYVIFFVGSAYSFYTKDPSVIITAMSASAALLAVKTYTQSKQLKNNQTDEATNQGDQT